MSERYPLIQIPWNGQKVFDALWWLAFFTVFITNNMWHLVTSRVTKVLLLFSWWLNFWKASIKILEGNWQSCMFPCHTHDYCKDSGGTFLVLSLVPKSKDFWESTNPSIRTFSTFGTWFRYKYFKTNIQNCTDFWFLIDFIPGFM